MLAELRLVQIRDQFPDVIDRIVPLVLEDETLQLIVYLRGGTNVRVTEKWRDESLERYSYYWLAADNQLKIGWDNAPHHKELDNFPHHKHIATPTEIQPSHETTFEAVMRLIMFQLPPPTSPNAETGTP